MFIAYDAQGGDGISNVVAIYQAAGVTVRVPANPADKATERAAAVTALNTALAGKPRQQYVMAFNTNRAAIFNAYMTFHEGFRTANLGNLAEYQTVLGNTLAILQTLPASFTTELANEQTGQGLPSAPVSAWTLTQCRGWHQLLGGWLGRATAGAAVAMIEGLD